VMRKRKSLHKHVVPRVMPEALLVRTRRVFATGLRSPLHLHVICLLLFIRLSCTALKYAIESPMPATMIVIKRSSMWAIHLRCAKHRLVAIRLYTCSVRRQNDRCRSFNLALLYKEA
jgi:hypothetical protein